MMQSADNNAATEAPTHRSRWRRLSPSMGWKAFWSEIVIVVLGVMIALAANEAVENWNWSIKVRDGEQRLREDVDRVFIYAAEIYSVAPCVEAQFSDLLDNLRKSESRLLPTPIYAEKSIRNQYVVRYPDRPYSFPVWQSLLADGTVAHMSAKRQAVYSHIYQTVIRFQNANYDNQRARGALLVMAEPLPLDANVRKDLHVEISEQTARYQDMWLYALRVMNGIRSMNLQPADEDVDKFLSASGTIAFCKRKAKPIGDWRAYSEH